MLRYSLYGKYFNQCTIIHVNGIANKINIPDCIILVAEIIIVKIKIDGDAVNQCQSKVHC